MTRHGQVRQRRAQHRPRRRPTPTSTCRWCGDFALAPGTRLQLRAEAFNVAQPRELRTAGGRPELGQLRADPLGRPAAPPAVRAEADLLIGTWRARAPNGATTSRYEGWRVVAASAVGVFVSFASLLRLHVRHLPQAVADEFGVVARGGLGAPSASRPCGGRLLAAAGLSVRSLRPAPRHPALPDDLRLHVRVAGAAHPTPLAPLCRLRRARHGRQRHRADGLLARGLELVRRSAAALRWR